MSDPDLLSPKTLLVTGIACCGLMFHPLLVGPAVAADWMFAPSYFTHPSSPGYHEETAPQSRSAYRRPYINTHGRMAVRSGYRFNNYSFRYGGANDRTLYQEYFIDAGN